MDIIKKTKAAIQLRLKQLKEQAEFDKLTPAEKERRRAAGMDPYEPEAIRNRKKALALEQRKKAFDKLPKEDRDALTRLGLSPYQDTETIVHRESGYFTKAY